MKICIKCNRCDQKYPDSVKFCPVCGTLLSEQEMSNEKHVNQGGTPKRPISEGDAQSLALVAYSDEYAAFKKKWLIGVVVACIIFWPVGIIIFFAYQWYFRPKFEQELVERYKKENNLS